MARMMMAGCEEVKSKKDDDHHARLSRNGKLCYCKSCLGWKFSLMQSSPSQNQGCSKQPLSMQLGGRGDLRLASQLRALQLLCFLLHLTD